MKHRFTADAAEDLAYWKKHDMRKVERLRLLLDDIKVNHSKDRKARTAVPSEVRVVVTLDRQGTPLGLFG